MLSNRLQEHVAATAIFVVAEYLPMGDNTQMQEEETTNGTIERDMRDRGGRKQGGMNGWMDGWMGSSTNSLQ